MVKTRHLSKYKKKPFTKIPLLGDILQDLHIVLVNRLLKTEKYKNSNKWVIKEISFKTN